jgi:hypothetical protein
MIDVVALNACHLLSGLYVNAYLLSIAHLLTILCCSSYHFCAMFPPLFIVYQTMYVGTYHRTIYISSKTPSVWQPSEFKQRFLSRLLSKMTIDKPPHHSIKSARPYTKWWLRRWFSYEVVFTPPQHLILKVIKILLSRLMYSPFILKRRNLPIIFQRT